MGYWAAGLGLIAFGILGLGTMGLPIAMIGVAMLVPGRIRRRKVLYWPLTLGLVAYNIAFWAIVPAYCSASSTVGGGSTAATCSSLIGIPWPDDATGMNVTPAAFGLAIVVGIVAAVVVLSWLRMDRERRSGSARRASSAGL